MSRSLFTLSIASCTLAIFAPAQAAPVTYSDEATFLSAATGPLAMESFEGEAATNSRTLSTLSLTDFDMTMSSGDTLGVFDLPDFAGGHSTDGDNYVGFSDGHDSVTYSFGAPIDMFGINIIDFGDFGSGSITFSNDAGDVFTAAIAGGPNANEQFFGIISDVSFDTVVLAQNISGEFYAVDEIYSGISDVPEPTSMALFGLTALGMGVVRRRRKTGEPSVA